MSVAIIINPVSGGARAGAARERAERASAVLRAGNEPAAIFVTERRGHARDLAAAAIARGDRLIIAWGGDGTLNEVGSAAAFSQTPIALVPTGSGNGLARTLGVSRTPERAIAEALRAVPRTIDAGELGGRLFFSVAGVGFDAHVAACFDRDLAGRRGLAAYVRISARELWGYRSESYRIDNAARERRALLVTFANSPQFGNGVRIAPSARLDDGLLDLVVVEERSRFATICSLPYLLTGRIGRARGVSIEQIEHAAIEANHAMAFHVDGESVRGGTRLEARVRPAALKICVR
jgi:YegS/Rv2252/BmrU family lipid kinase